MRCDASKEPPARSRRPLLVGRYSAVRMPAAAGGYSALLRFDPLLFLFFEKRFDLVADWDWDSDEHVYAMAHLYILINY